MSIQKINSEIAEKYIQEHGSIRKAATEAGVARSTLRRHLNRNEVKTHYTQSSPGKFKHAVIPDCQVKPGVPLDYLKHVGRYIADKMPDTIICIGDFADMHSLSSYDKGKKCFEGRRYKNDIESAREGLSYLMKPIVEKSARTGWKPRKVVTLGNHEDRITRAVNDEPILDGTIGLEDLPFRNFGWEVYDFLHPVKIDGIMYAHYFTSGLRGKPVASARALAMKKHQTCIMGHVQNWDMHREVRADGTPFLGLFCGSAYEHNEDYLGPQENNYWRGIWMLHEVHDGDFQPMQVSLDYLRRRYGGD